jgi:hypothetical protein
MWYKPETKKKKLPQKKESSKLSPRKEMGTCTKSWRSRETRMW